MQGTTTPDSALPFLVKNRHKGKRRVHDAHIQKSSIRVTKFSVDEFDAPHKNLVEVKTCNVQKEGPTYFSKKIREYDSFCEPTDTTDEVCLRFLLLLCHLYFRSTP